MRTKLSWLMILGGFLVVCGAYWTKTKHGALAYYSPIETPAIIVIVLGMILMPSRRRELRERTRRDQD